MKSTSARRFSFVLAASAAALSACRVSSTAQTAPPEAPEIPAATSKAPRYKLQKIADVNTGEGAVAMNNRGQVLLGTEGSNILLWQDGKLRKLPAVATMGSARRKSRRSRRSRAGRTVAIWDANDINDRGQIVGMAADGQACVYEKGKLRLLGAMSNGQKWDASATNPRQNASFLDRNGAKRINEAGDIIGFSLSPQPTERIFSGVNPDNSTRGWLLKRAGAGGATILQGGKYGVYVQGINEAGHIVGIFEPGETVEGFPINHAFLWSGNGKLQDLGEGDAQAINNRGQVAGGVSNEENDVEAKALLWEGGQKRELGLGRAKAINNAGQIVGLGRENNVHKSRGAALWLDGQQVMLKDRLDKDYKVSLVDAHLINDRGQIVVQASPSWDALNFYALLSPVLE